jgi:excisionase family DNA binding protein
MVEDGKLRPMLTVREVAELLHIHANTVRRWSDQGLLRAYRITHRGDRRFKREEVARFLAELNHNGEANEEVNQETRGREMATI